MASSVSQLRLPCLLPSWTPLLSPAEPHRWVEGRIRAQTCFSGARHLEELKDGAAWVNSRPVARGDHINRATLPGRTLHDFTHTLLSPALLGLNV